MIKIGRIVDKVEPPIPLKVTNERNYRKIKCINVYSGLNIIEKAEFSSLHPNNLKEISGRILSNVWKFCKLYSHVPRIKMTGFSGRLPIDVWNHPAEIHVTDDGIITKNYWDWRKKGFSLKYPISSPIGSLSEDTCIGFIQPYHNITNNIKKENIEILSTIQARQIIFYRTYQKLVKREKKFYELIEWLKNGQNLFIIDSQGPYYEDLEYYKEKYNVDNDFISPNNIVTATEKNIKILLNDDLHEAGFSYYFASLLLGFNPFNSSE